MRLFRENQSAVVLFLERRAAQSRLPLIFDLTHPIYHDTFFPFCSPPPEKRVSATFKRCNRTTRNIFSGKYITREKHYTRDGTKGQYNIYIYIYLCILLYSLEEIRGSLFEKILPINWKYIFSQENNRSPQRVLCFLNKIATHSWLCTHTSSATLIGLNEEVKFFFGGKFSLSLSPIIQEGNDFLIQILNRNSIYYIQLYMKTTQNSAKNGAT